MAVSVSVLPFGVARGTAPSGVGVGVHVMQKARDFDTDGEPSWAKQTYGKDWTTAMIKGTIIAPGPGGRRNEWKVRWSDGDVSVSTSRQLKVDKVREAERLAACRFSRNEYSLIDRSIATGKYLYK